MPHDMWLCVCSVNIWPACAQIKLSWKDVRVGSGWAFQIFLPFLSDKSLPSAIYADVGFMVGCHRYTLFINMRGRCKKEKHCTFCGWMTPPKKLISIFRGWISWYIPRDWLMMRKLYPHTAERMDVLRYTSLALGKSLGGCMSLVRFPNPLATGSDIHGSWGTWLVWPMLSSLSGKF